MSLRIVYLGTPEFAVPPLEALIAGGYAPLAVISRPDKARGRGQKLLPTPVKAAALAAGLAVLTPENLNTPPALAELSAFKPDLLVVVAFGQILRQPILDLAPAVNLHASLLPAYRGAAPIHRAVLDGQSLSGVTTMFLDTGLDTGDMILKANVEIGPNDTTGVLHNQLATVGSELLLQTVRLIDQGQAPREPQNNDLASYALKLMPEDECLNWQDTAAAIHNRVRGLNPWPGAHTAFQDKRLKIWQTIWRPSRFSGLSGQVVAVDRQGIWLATGEGEICLLEVQPAGKPKMAATDFARGYQVVPEQMMG